MWSQKSDARKILKIWPVQGASIRRSTSVSAHCESVGWCSVWSGFGDFLTLSIGENPLANSPRPSSWSQETRFVCVCSTWTSFATAACLQPLVTVRALPCSYRDVLRLCSNGPRPHRPWSLPVSVGRFAASVLSNFETFSVFFHCLHSEQSRATSGPHCLSKWYSTSSMMDIMQMVTSPLPLRYFSTSSFQASSFATCGNIMYFVLPFCQWHWDITCLMSSMKSSTCYPPNKWAWMEFAISSSSLIDDGIFLITDDIFISGDSSTWRSITLERTRRVRSDLTMTFWKYSCFHVSSRTPSEHCTHLLLVQGLRQKDRFFSILSISVWASNVSSWSTLDKSTWHIRSCIRPPVWSHTACHSLPPQNLHQFLPLLLTLCHWVIVLRLLTFGKRLIPSILRVVFFFPIWIGSVSKSERTTEWMMLMIWKYVVSLWVTWYVTVTWNESMTEQKTTKNQDVLFDLCTSLGRQSQQATYCTFESFSH